MYVDSNEVLNLRGLGSAMKVYDTNQLSAMKIYDTNTFSAARPMTRRAITPFKIYDTTSLRALGQQGANLSESSLFGGLPTWSYLAIGVGLGALGFYLYKRYA